jgi:hypothetical protein
MKHCKTCVCDKRAPVQGSIGKPSGTIEWSEHLKAYGFYTSLYGTSQSAERIAERGGFSYKELVQLLGREPKTFI